MIEQVRAGIYVKLKPLEKLKEKTVVATPEMVAHWHEPIRIIEVRNNVVIAEPLRVLQKVPGEVIVFIYAMEWLRLVQTKVKLN
jgi:hypothetical protein